MSKEQAAGLHEQLQHAQTQVSSLSAANDKLLEELRAAQASLEASKDT